jgi:hypothetical protein
MTRPNLNARNLDANSTEKDEELLKVPIRRGPNPHMSEVLKLLQSGSLKGVSDLIGQVAWMSESQANFFANFFGKSKSGNFNTEYVFSLKKRSQGAPRKDVSRQRGEYVAEMRSKLLLNGGEFNLKSNQKTVYAAISAAKSKWPVQLLGKEPTAETLRKDYDRFQKITKHAEKQNLFKKSSSVEQ